MAVLILLRVSVVEEATNCGARRFHFDFRLQPLTTDRRRDVVSLCTVTNCFILPLHAALTRGRSSFRIPLLYSMTASILSQSLRRYCNARPTTVGSSSTSPMQRASLLRSTLAAQRQRPLSSLAVHPNGVYNNGNGINNTISNGGAVRFMSDDSSRLHSTE
jgi:hypothetical protein